MVPRPHGSLVAVPTYLDLCSGWIARRLCRHKYAVLACMLGPGAVRMPMHSYRVTSSHCRPWPACPHLVSAAVSAHFDLSGSAMVSVPYLPPSVLSWNSVSLWGHSGGLIPPEQLFHSGGVDAPWRLDSPSHSLEIPPWVSVTLEASRPPSLPPTPEDFPSGFSCQPATLSLSPSFNP